MKAIIVVAGGGIQTHDWIMEMNLRNWQQFPKKKFALPNPFLHTLGGLVTLINYPKSCKTLNFGRS